MSVPFIQLGQCGNQVGESLYSMLFNEAQNASPAHQGLMQQFFDIGQKTKNHAKAFLIDMQPKVVTRNLSINKPWAYNKAMSLVQQEGSGNNWAYGCNVHGPRIKEALEDLFTTFAEKEDYIKAFVQIQSMAGGTGSGLGTYIVELLGDMFPKTPKFISCVMPHLSGEVILQSYNACLCLGTIYQQADGIFIIENDQISNICKKKLNIKHTSLQNINEIIGRNLASTFFPVVNRKTEQIFSVEENEFNYGLDLIENLFYDNRYKLCSIQTAPHGSKDSQSFNFDSWQAVENELMYRKRTKSKAMMMIARGPDHPNSLSSECPTLFDRHCFYKYNRSITLLDNCDGFVQQLDGILERGYQMLKEGAYLYQYQKSGLEKDKFVECFSIIEGIQSSYKGLAR